MKRQALATTVLQPTTAEEIEELSIIQQPFAARLQTQYSPDSDTLVVSGLVLRLEDWSSGAFKNINLYGHVVRVGGKLKTDGARNISLFARYVVFEPDASIDVSGKPGSVPVPWKAEQGAAGDWRRDINGQQGANGARGFAGEDGGSIRITAEHVVGIPVLMANGGPGGRGQDGGDGGPGDVTGGSRRIGKGGNGGAGGQRGKNGDGGSISIGTVHPYLSGKLQSDPGQDFVTDAEAEGGSGGRGGSLVLARASSKHPSNKQEKTVHPDRIIVVVYSESFGDARITDGPRGESGGSPPPAENGEHGRITEKRITHSDLGTALASEVSQASYWSQDRSVVSMVLFAAEQFSMMSEPPEKRERLHNVLGYLLRVTAGSGKPGLQVIHKKCLALRFLGLPKSQDEIVDRRIASYLFETQLQTHYTPDPDTLVVSGLDLKLDDWIEGSYRNIHLYGHMVTVGGKLKTDGARSISIFARYVIFEPGASIDVSGSPGKAAPGKAKSSTVTGGQGENGASGGPGENGGNIHIVAESVLGNPALVANGGPGGRGQDGGDGGPGTPGSNGADDYMHGYGRYKKIRRGGPGGPGGKGGKGGMGGQRGGNGDGGSLAIESVFPYQSGRLQVEPGEDLVTDSEAKGGNGGPGGVGGRGGKHLEWTRTTRYANGAQGAPGDAGDTPPAAEAGKPGKIAEEPATYAELGKNLAQQVSGAGYASPDSSVVAMVLFATERLYLNADCIEDVTALQVVLRYLLNVTAGSRAPKMQAVFERCLVLSMNLERGLDYFGKLPNFVPSLSFKENELLYTACVEVARDLETDYDIFWDRKQTEEKRRAALEAQTTKVKDFTDKHLKPELLRLDKEITSYANSISSLTMKVQEKEQEVRNASEDFKDALRRKLDCQSFMTVLAMVKSIVQIGINARSVFTVGIGNLEDALARDKEKGEKKKSDSTIIKDMVKVQATVQDIVKSYNTIRDIRRRLGEDSAKLVTGKQEFDQMMKPYMDIPEAKPYVKTVHEYIELINKRNTAIANHDSAMIQYDNIEKQIELSEEEAADLRTQILIDANPLRPVFVQYMSKTLQMVKSLIIERLYRMSRSVEYYTLSQIPIHFVDYRISTLETHYADLLTALSRGREEVGSRSNFRRSIHIDNPAQLELLKQGKPVWISLPLNTNEPKIPPFENIQRPMVRTVECFLEGVASAKPEGTATITIQHCGVSSLFDETHASEWTFVHSPRTISFEYSIADKKYEDGQGDLTEDGQFMMLSPFAVWALQIRPEDAMNEQLDLSNLKRVTLRFKGKGALVPIRKSLKGRQHPKTRQ